MNFMPFILIDTNSFKDLIMSVLEFNVFIKKKKTSNFLSLKNNFYIVLGMYTPYML